MQQTKHKPTLIKTGGPLSLLKFGFDAKTLLSSWINQTDAMITFHKGPLCHLKNDGDTQNSFDEVPKTGRVINWKKWTFK